MASERNSVTIIGLGEMGTALTETALERGYEATVWNRSNNKARLLEAKGAKIAPDLRSALGSHSPILFCVTDHNATMSLLDQDDLLLVSKGKTIVQLSTVTSAESKSLFQWSQSAGALYLDGQILSYPDDMREGRGTIVCSGDKRIFKDNFELLDDLAGNAIHVGDQVGAAPAFDKAHLAWAIGNYFGFIQAAAMCRRSGVDLNSWCKHNLQYLESGDAAREFEILAEQICSRNYEHGFDASLEVWGNVTNKTVQEFETAKMNHLQLTYVADLTQKAIAKGMGKKELGFLFELMLSDDLDVDSS